MVSAVLTTDVFERDEELGSHLGLRRASGGRDQRSTVIEGLPGLERLAEQRRRVVCESARNVLAVRWLSAHQPIVLAVDDAHWGDGASLEWLRVTREKAAKAGQRVSTTCPLQGSLAARRAPRRAGAASVSA